MKLHTGFSKRVSERIRVIGAVFSVLALMVYMVPIVNVADAASLTTPRDYLSRQQGGVATGIQHEVFFYTTTAVSGGAGNNEVILMFPDADDGLWCRTAGSLTVTGITNPTGATETAASVLPGTLAGTCAQGSGASSYDTFTITGVNDLSATTRYGVRFTGLVAVLGTAAAANSIQVTVKTNNGSTDVDTGTIALSLIASDQVAVSATVVPTLTVSLDTNTAALGTLNNSNINQAGIVQTVTTNAGNGYISLVKYGATLTAGSFTIPDTSGGTIVAGTSEFGASSSDTGNTIGVWSPAACSSTATTSNATALTAAYQDYALAVGAVSSEQTTLCLLASVAGTQGAGVYTSTITVVTTARF